MKAFEELIHLGQHGTSKTMKVGNAPKIVILHYKTVTMINELQITHPLYTPAVFEDLANRVILLGAIPPHESCLLMSSSWTLYIRPHTTFFES